MSNDTEYDIWITDYYIRRVRLIQTYLREGDNLPNREWRLVGTITPMSGAPILDYEDVYAALLNSLTNILANSKHSEVRDSTS